MMPSWYTLLLLNFTIYWVETKGEFAVPVITSTYFHVFIFTF